MRYILQLAVIVSALSIHTTAHRLTVASKERLSVHVEHARSLAEQNKTGIRWKRTIALIFGMASLVAGEPSNTRDAKWSVNVQSPVTNHSFTGAGALETTMKPQRMMLTSTGFSGADGSESRVVKAAFEALLPSDVPKRELRALVINAPTALREGVFGNADAPVDAESFGPQLASLGIGEVVALDVLSKSHVDLESGEAQDWARLVDKAYNVNTMSFPDSADLLQGDAFGTKETLGHTMEKFGAELDKKHAADIREFVSQFDIIAVNGGEPATALLAMRTSPEFANAVTQRIQDGDAVGIFRSAGSMLAGADAGLTDEIDDQVRANLLNGDTIGLQLIPGQGAVRPHFGEHWHGPMVDYEAALVGQGQDVQFWGIPNGQAVTCIEHECREVGDGGLPGDQFVEYLAQFHDVVTTDSLA